jgi:hypothetical protein
MRTSDIDWGAPPIHAIVLGELGTGKTSFMAQAAKFSQCAWVITDPNTLPTLLSLGLDVEYETFAETDLTQVSAFNDLCDYVDKILNTWTKEGKNNPSSTLIIDGIPGLMDLAMYRAMFLKGNTPPKKGNSSTSSLRGDPLGYYRAGKNTGLQELKSISDMGDYNVMGSMVKHMLSHIAMQPCNVLCSCHILAEKDATGNIVEDICVNRAMKQPVPSRFSEAWVIRSEEHPLAGGGSRTVRVIDTRASISRYARTAYEHILMKREKAYLPYLRDKIIAGLKKEDRNTLDYMDPGEVVIDQDKKATSNATQKGGWTAK